MPTEISGSTGVNKITDGTIVNADINSSAAIAGSKLVMPTGSVLQVVEGSYSSQTDVSSTSYADTGLSVAITPSSSSSKIFAMINVHTYLNGSGFIGLNICRGSTQIVEANKASGYDDNTSEMVVLTKLDSPSTTSATTYKAQMKTVNFTGTARINQQTGGSRITLMEIAG